MRTKFLFSQRFSRQNSKIIGQQLIIMIDELVRTKRVVDVPFVPKVVNPMSLSTNKGKKRLILDLCYVNNYLWKEKVKFEDWRVFQHYLSRDGCIFNFDLKSGNHYVNIYPKHQTYLGFSWVVDGVRKYCVYCATIWT